MRPGIPEEGGEIVLHRPPATALEVDEAGLPVPDHHVARLEVAVHEDLSFKGERVRAHAVEVVLQPDLVELEARELQEIVFEIVEVEVHHPGVELPVGEADAPVHAFAHLELHGGQQGHRVVQPVPLFLREGAVREGGFQELEQLSLAQVLLDIGHPVRRHAVHGGGVEPVVAELRVEREEGAVLGRIGADAADHGAAFSGHPVILAGAARQGQQVGSVRRAAGPFLIESGESFHIHRRIYALFENLPKVLKFAGCL